MEVYDAVRPYELAIDVRIDWALTKTAVVHNAANRGCHTTVELAELDVVNTRPRRETQARCSTGRRC
jgi:hypothetical protein